MTRAAVLYVFRVMVQDIAYERVGLPHRRDLVLVLQDGTYPLIHLGVEKNNQEFFQITIGGRADENAELGALIGPAVPYDDVADVVEDIVAAYLELRERPDEIFLETVKRVGVEPFKERVYATR